MSKNNVIKIATNNADNERLTVIAELQSFESQQQIVAPSLAKIFGEAIVRNSCIKSLDGQ